MRKLILFMLLMFGIFASMASASVFQFINESGTIQLNINMLTGEADFTGVIKESGILLSLTYIAISDESTLNVNSTNLWDTLDSPANFASDSISEAVIDFDTACAAGNHYYLNGNNLACEADADTQLSEEQVEDFVGTMLGGTETHISVSYVDGGEGAGLIDFVVSDDWWDALGDMSLTSAYIYVGTAGNIPAGVAVSGDITISNAGVVSLASNSVEDNEINYAAVTVSDFANDAGYFDSIANTTGTLTNTYFCRYDSGGTEIDCDVDPSTIGVGNTTEEMQDAVMAAIDDGTQIGITVTYQDGTNDMDFEVTDLYVNTAGDTMTGDLNMSGTDGVIVSSHPGKIIFNATGVFIIA